MSIQSKREHILDLMPEELAERLAALGMPKFRTKQIHEWIFQKRAKSFGEMTNLSLADRQLLEERFTLFTAKVIRKQTAVDGTEKVLVQWNAEASPTRFRSRFQTGGDSEEIDGDEALEEIQAEAAVPRAEGADTDAVVPALTTESVMIPCDDDMCDEYGNTTAAHRRTACLSTQVGCPVGCKFCASGLEGLQGNLTAGQIIEQALRLQHELPIERRLTNIVFMGMGEPLANFEATVRAVRILMAEWAFHISGRKITVSTVGLPPQMKKLADLALPVTLAISLHAPNDELRRQIIPWANKISLEKIIEAGRYYFDKTGRELTLEYIMLEDKRGPVNTMPEHARQLAAIAKQMRANVNLIYYNEVPELPFKRPVGQTMFAFQTILRGQHVNCHIRKSRGREIAAACGQLARQDKRERLVQISGPGPK